MNAEMIGFHLTHPKAGSQWVMAVLAACAPGRVVVPKVRMTQFYDEPLLAGRLYAAVFAPKRRFDQRLRDQPHIEPSQVRKVFVMRDLRDSLVSLYFSLKVSHPLISENVAQGRQELQALDEEEGILHLLERRSKGMAEIQGTWLQPCMRGEALLVRYEDLLADEQQYFARIVAHLELPTSANKLQQIVEQHSFSRRAGRKPGQEDVGSHYRKGVAGDWRNHFTDRIKEEFKLRHGQLLIDTGYERDLNW